jgi:hypothetical protein
MQDLGRTAEVSSMQHYRDRYGATSADPGRPHGLRNGP